ncbi:MAG: glycosyltransferase [Actinobacteria bacterium]|nr:glycosyltransferase [Actinomycetota bacterium]
MRVCHVIHDLRRGGAEHLLVDLAGAAAGAGLEMSVVSLMPTGGHGYADDLRRAGVDVRSLDLRTRWDPLAGRRLAALLADRTPDLLHTHLKHADLVGARAARALGIPMVSSLHVVEDAVGAVGRLKRRLAMRARDRAAARIVAVSSALRDWYLSLSGRDPSSVVVLRNGVPAHPPVSPGDRAAGREALGVPPEAVLAATVVILRPGKGVDDLLAAAASLPAGPDVRFVVAGSGPEEQRLRDRAAALGLGGRVTFIGFVEDVAGLLAAADLLVHPSHADALATALIHGMAAGLPAVATAVGGTPELIGPGHGILVPAADPDALAAAVAALASDPERRASMGRAARERFDEEFEIGVWASRLAEIYREVAAPGH